MTHHVAKHCTKEASAAAEAATDAAEFVDQNGNVWIRKNPSSDVRAVHLTVEDLDLLACKHKEVGARKRRIGDHSAVVLHALAETRFLTLARDLEAGWQGGGVKATSPCRTIAALNEAGFDQDGRQWIPRKPADGLLCVPLSFRELLILHDFYKQAATRAAVASAATRWAAFEQKRATFLRQASELDKASLESYQIHLEQKAPAFTEFRVNSGTC